MMLDNYTVPNKELRVSVGMRFEDKKLGAQTSGTDTAHQGIKPKSVTVSLIIPFVDVAQLTALTRTAQALRADGSLHIYDITEETANAMMIKQVQFSESFDVRTDWRLNAWQVSFALLEYQSVPEKAEQRQNKVTAVVQQAAGDSIGAGEGAATETQEPIGTMESILAKIDGMLAPAPTSTNETT